MKKRNINLDLIRCVAVLFVISVHFLKDTGFYNVPILSKRIILLNNLRIILMSCVPMFLLLTGYLKNNKKLSKEYYKGIIRILAIYLITSIFCLIFKYYYLNEEISLREAIISLLNFSANTYSWYIEMYIGLFCFIPFLNIIFNNIKNKRGHQALIFTLFIFTILPTIINVYDLSSFQALITSKVNSTHTIIFNDYWYALYPITYYFVGAYISKYKCKYSSKKMIISLIFCFTIFSIFNTYRNYNLVFFDDLYTQYNGVETFICAILIFLIILNLKLEKIPNFIKKIIIIISNLSLGIYLSSKIADLFIYPILNSKILDVGLRVNWMIPTIIVVFTLSLILSGLASLIYRVIIIIISKIKYKVLKEQKD